MRILFMGTPDFALFSLRALVDSGENVVGVVTQPDKPRGRGYELQPSPIKKYALEKNLPVYQPATFKDGAFASTLKEIAPDLIVVAAFGKILPPYVLNFPPFGCINVHGSLLPALRGAAPMQRALIDGLQETGVTIMQMDSGLDTGDMLLSRAITIGENDNFEDIHDRLGAVGAAALLDAIDRVKKGTLTPTKQDESKATYAAKIEKADCLLPFSASADRVHNLIRGLSPVPLAFTHTPDGKLLKVPQSRIVDRSTPHERPGEILSLDGGVITVACGTGAISLLTVLPEGKGRMSAADYIRGRKIAVGDILS